MIYLDNAATSWPKPEVVYRAVDQCLRSVGGSAGRGGHAMAQTAVGILYEAREELAGLFHIKDPTNISFTANATEALNTAIFGLLKPGDRVVTTSMEHNAVARPLRYLANQGVKLDIVNCNSRGELSVVDMAAALAKEARVVTMTHASNVTGTIMPLTEVAALAQKAGAVMIVDAAQTAGVEDIDVERMGIDILTFAGHKSLLGPQGTGGIYLRPGVEIEPLRLGGTGSFSESDLQPEIMPDRLESGTANTPGIAGLGAGVKFIRQAGIDNIRRQETLLTQALLVGLKKIKGVTVYGPPAGQARAAVISFTIAGQDSVLAGHRLSAEFGIACRAGLHCAPWAHRTIGTLESGAIRFSPGYFNNMMEIEAAVRAVGLVAK